MKKLMLPIMLLAFLFSNCFEKDPVKPEQTKPEISNIKSPDSLFATSIKQELFSAKVEDPQGPEDISVVLCHIHFKQTQQLVQTDTLVDNGKQGDVVPKDGTYTKKISAEFTEGNAGIYTLVFKAIDKAGNESEPVSRDILVSDKIQNIAPVITTVAVDTVLDLAIPTEITLKVSATDPQGLADIQYVVSQIFFSDDNVPFLQNTLYDDGMNDDEIANDGMFTLKINPTIIEKMLVGKYFFSIQAFDKSGIGSEKVGEYLQVINSLNEPPVISELSAPDTMKLANTGSGFKYAKITIKAEDPQKLSDIYAVYFYSTKPNGELANKGNPLYLLDDGNIKSDGEPSESYDDVADDGIYTFIVSLPDQTDDGTPTQRGNYNFKFEAIDRSDAKSNQITHILTVIE
ncbi:hypothetical protein JW964_02390 [candidate division KSB1 bacterium]|nr:hypothetical protein [candidate division KSB1 bacterium]